MSALPLTTWLCFMYKSANLSRIIKMAEQMQDYYCRVCRDVLQDPIILPCLHTFCRSCVSNYSNCPNKICTERVPNDKAGIPENPVFANMVQSYNHIISLAQNSDSELKCSDCLDTPPKNAVFFCLDCQELMCRSDYESHNRAMLRGKKHSQVRLQDGEHLEDLVLKPTSPVFMCKVHNTECIYLCKAEGQYICKKCLKEEHKGHNIRDLDYYAGDVKDELAKDIGKMTRGKENEMEIQRYYEQKLVEMTQEESTLLKRIEDEFNSKIEALNKHRDNLLEQVRNLSKQHRDFMKELMSRQEGLIDKLNEFKVVTRPYLYEYPVTYLLEVSVPIRDRIKQLERELHPDEATEPKKIQFAIGKLGEITSNPEEYGCINLIGQSSLSFQRPPRQLFDQSADDPLKPRCIGVNDKGQAFILRTPLGSTSRYCLDTLFSYNLGNKFLRKQTHNDANTDCVSFSGQCTMALSKQGKIAIADISESSIYVFNIDFAFITVIRGSAGGLNMIEPINITFSSKEQLIVASGYNSSVIVFTSDVKSRQIDSSFCVEQNDIDLNPNVTNRANPIVNMAVNSLGHIFLLLHYDPWFMICDFEGTEIPVSEYQALSDLVEEVYKPKSKMRKIYNRYDTPLLREKALIYVDSSDNVYLYYKTMFAVYNNHYKESTTYPATDIEEPICMACDNLSNVYFCTASHAALVYGTI